MPLLDTGPHLDTGPWFITNPTSLPDEVTANEGPPTLHLESNSVSSPLILRVQNPKSSPEANNMQTQSVTEIEG